MALIKCPQCNNSVSSGAKFCPQCAYPLNDESSEEYIMDSNYNSELDQMNDNYDRVENLPEINKKTRSVMQGIVKKFKINEITLEFAITKIQSLYQTKLEVFFYEMSFKKKLAKEKIKNECERYLSQLKLDYIEINKELGVQFSEAITNSLDELNDKMLSDIEKISNKNWPLEYKEEAINLNKKSRKIFYDTISRTIDSLRDKGIII